MRVIVCLTSRPGRQVILLIALGPGRITDQFLFCLEKSNCIRPEIKKNLSSYGRISTSENASVSHTGEI